MYLLRSIGVSLLSCLSLSCFQFLGSTISFLLPTLPCSPSTMTECCFIMSWSFLENPRLLLDGVFVGVWGLCVWGLAVVRGGRVTRPLWVVAGGVLVCVCVRNNGTWDFENMHALFPNWCSTTMRPNFMHIRGNFVVWGAWGFPTCCFTGEIFLYVVVRGNPYFTIEPCNTLTLTLKHRTS